MRRIEALIAAYYAKNILALEVNIYLFVAYCAENKLYIHKTKTWPTLEWRKAELSETLARFAISKVDLWAEWKGWASIYPESKHFIP